MKVKQQKGTKSGLECSTSTYACYGVHKPLAIYVFFVCLPVCHRFHIFAISCSQFIKGYLSSMNANCECLVKTILLPLKCVVQQHQGSTSPLWRSHLNIHTKYKLMNVSRKQLFSLSLHVKSCWKSWHGSFSPGKALLL